MKIYIIIMVLFTLGYAGIRYGAASSLKRHINGSFYVSVAIIYFAGFALPNAAPLLLLCVVSTLVQVKTRMDVVCRYMLMMPMVPGMAPALTAGGHVIGLFNLTDALGLGALIATILARNDPRVAAIGRFTAEDAFAIVTWLIWTFGSTRFDSATVELRAMLTEAFIILVPYWVLRQNVRTREELRLAVACLIASCAILCVIALYESRSGWALFDPMESRFGGDTYLGHSASVRGGVLRATATMSTPLELGFFLMLCLPAMVAVRRFFSKREVWLGAGGLLALALVATQSRGMVVGLVAGLLVMMVARRRFVATLAVGGFAALAYLVLIAASRTSYRVAAFMGAGKEYGGHADYRGFLLQRGMEEGMKHPVLGISTPNVMKSLADIAQGEGIIDIVNTYLNIFLISGVVGLGATVLLAVLIYRNLIATALPPTDTVGQQMRVYVLAALTATLVAIAGMSFFARIPFLLMFVTVAARVVHLARTSATRNASNSLEPIPRPETALA